MDQGHEQTIYKEKMQYFNYKKNFNIIMTKYNHNNERYSFYLGN